MRRIWAHEISRLYLEVLGCIIPNSGFRLRYKPQIAVPVIQTEYAAREGETLAAIARINALYLVREKSFIELDDRFFQLMQDCLKLVAGGNVVLV